MNERYYLANVVIDMATKCKYDEEIHTISFYLKHDGELTSDDLLLKIKRNHQYNRAKSIDIKSIGEISENEYQAHT